MGEPLLLRVAALRVKHGPRWQARFLAQRIAGFLHNARRRFPLGGAPAPPPPKWQQYLAKAMLSYPSFVPSTALTRAWWFLISPSLIGCLLRGEYGFFNSDKPCLPRL